MSRILPRRAVGRGRDGAALPAGRAAARTAAGAAAPEARRRADGLPAPAGRGAGLGRRRHGGVRAAGEIAVPVEGAGVARVRCRAVQPGFVAVAEAFASEQDQPAAAQQRLGERVVHLRARKALRIARAAGGSAHEHAVEDAAAPQGQFFEIFQKPARKHRLEIGDQNVRAARKQGARPAVFELFGEGKHLVSQGRGQRFGSGGVLSLRTAEDHKSTSSRAAACVSAPCERLYFTKRL